MRRWLLLAPFFALSLTACSALAGLEDKAPTIGAPAPDFELQTPQGETLALDDFRGQVVLLNFWATWCGPCEFEMPIFQQRYERGDFVILAVDFDEPAELVVPFLQDLGVTFPALLDPGGKIQNLYQVRGYPTTFFIDEQGIIRIEHIGMMNDDQLDGYLEEMGLLN